jgi:hypothetical protein
MVQDFCAAFESEFRQDPQLFNAVDVYGNPLLTLFDNLLELRQEKIEKL